MGTFSTNALFDKMSQRLPIRLDCKNLSLALFYCSMSVWIRISKYCELGGDILEKSCTSRNISMLQINGYIRKPIGDILQ